MKKISILLIVFFMSIIFIETASAKKSVNKSIQLMKGKVSFIKGSVFIKKNKEWKKLKINTVLTKKDLIKVDKKSLVKIKLSNGKLIKVVGKKIVKVQNLMVDAGKKKPMNSIIKKMQRDNGKAGFGVTGVAGVRGADVKKKNKKVKKEDLDWSE